jgi:hypothetical protein
MGIRERLASKIFNIDENGESNLEPDEDGYVESGTHANIQETPLQRALGLRSKERIFPNAMMPTEGIDTSSDKQKMLEVYDEIKREPTEHGIFVVRGLSCKTSNYPHDGIDLRDFEEYMMATNHVRAMHDIMRYHNARRIAIMKGYASMEKKDRNMMYKGKPLG